MDPAGNLSLRNCCSCFHEEIADLSAIFDDGVRPAECSGLFQVDRKNPLLISSLFFRNLSEQSFRFLISRKNMIFFKIVSPIVLLYWKRHCKIWKTNSFELMF